MSRGLVVREGIVDIRRVRRYAKRNKLPVIDLRSGMAFASVEQLSNNLSVRISNAFRRPLRADISSFFNGECFGKRFVAIVPHNFISDFAITTKRSPRKILHTLNNNESILV